MKLVAAGKWSGDDLECVRKFFSWQYIVEILTNESSHALASCRTQ